MSGVPCETVHLLLQAELDGELDAAGAAGLASHLATCDACRALRDQLEALSAQLREVPRFELPAGLREAVAALEPRAQPDRRRRRAWSHAGAFGAGLAVAAAVLLAVPMAGPVPGGSAGAELLDAHLRGLQPGHLVDVPSSDQHTVKPWFNGRIGLSPDVPDLAQQGFPLLGGRMDYVNGRPTAVLVYGRRQHVIDVFVQDGPVRPAAGGEGFNVAQWRTGGLNYAAVSDLNKDDLVVFAGLMERQGAPGEGREPAH